MRPVRRPLQWLLPGLLYLLGAGRFLSAADAADFNRDVRPILSRHCFKCHGPDETTRQGGVRLDVRETALQAAESGARIVVPGRPDVSELMRRIESDDPEVVMPPPSTHMELTPAQTGILKSWIAAGAPYSPHWAFVVPRAAPLPPVKRIDWPRNAIDRFVLAELERQGLAPAPEADRYVLARRASLDLIGLPPSPEVVDAFVRDDRPDAYEQFVERLLASPQYGERWAREWLDLARYADTNGYEKDRVRSVWPYRDWVIRALNADLPFDQFTVEQLAGDMLPNPAQEQRIATGFHRNTMLNEEGGIDPLEFRFHAMTDRLSTTGAVWLGLTVGCAQCHTHKYDPLTHTEYYRLMAFLNNADEPEVEVPAEDTQTRRTQIEAQIAQRQRELPQKFPPLDAWTWRTPHVIEATSAQGATITIEGDETLVVSGHTPDTDTYTLVVETPQTEISGIQIEALTDARLGHKGPGRTPHGNFVITEVQVDQKSDSGRAEPIQFQAAMADFSQDKFPAQHVIDGKPETGWAIHGPGQWNVPRTLTVRFGKRVRMEGSSRWTIRLEQWFGAQHTLGKFRVRLGSVTDTRSARARQQAHLEQRFAEWKKELEGRAVPWTSTAPLSWKTTLPRLELLDDASLLTSGDLTKRDVFDLTFGPELNGATAIRIEALPHESLPRRGPGAVYYEGPRGDFFLSEIQWLPDGASPLPWAGAAHSFANAHHTSDAAIDGNPLTGWSIDGRQGGVHVAVFRFAGPLPTAEKHLLRMIFERYYAAAIGRFRISYTTAAVAPDTALAASLEQILLIPDAQRTAEMREQLLREFCEAAPELAGERSAMDQLRKQLPEAPTALVFRERPQDNPRPTRRHHRGEFLQPKEEVSPEVPTFLHPLDPGAPRNRLTFSRWLVDPRNPLVGRVTVNRHWSAFFGRGIVRTSEDFGYQGEPPTHPQLLDWLAVEFMRRDWSVKELHRLIVTSAAYRQSSRLTPELLLADPHNRWLARGPRVRLDAELIRDSALAVAGLLSDKQFGPSVFPPQPPSVTTEGSYGKLSWDVSPGEDRYRRGLYTFAKRTAPYAMFTTFDAPSGEACVPRREASNTPLQALTLLNDAVFMETAQALGQQAMASEGEQRGKLRQLFRRVVVRPPTDDETALLHTFLEAQLARNPTSVAAAWTATARALLNLDETITKE